MRGIHRICVNHFTQIKHGGKIKFVQSPARIAHGQKHFFSGAKTTVRHNTKRNGE
jgi:hypothetical protein